MSELEREIIEKFRQLPLDAKQRLRALIEQEVDAETDRNEGSAFDYEAWLNEVKALRQHVRAKHGDKPRAINVLDVLTDLGDGESK